MIDTATVLLAAVRTIVLILGMTISYLSYKAYRRTESPYLRNASIGFAIVAFGVFLEGILYELLHFSLYSAHIIESVVVAIGFGVLLYSLLR